MAAVPDYARHGTLVASTVTTVTLPRDVVRIVVKVRGSGTVYGNLDGAAAPTVGGNDTFAIDAGASQTFVSSDYSAAEVIKLISSGTPGYSVEAYRI